MKNFNRAVESPSPQALSANGLSQLPLKDLQWVCNFRQAVLEKRRACRIGLAGNARNPAACAVVMAK